MKRAALAIAVFCLPCLAQDDIELLRKLEHGRLGEQLEAIEALAERHGDDFEPLLRKRLSAENPFHVAIALNHALAWAGNIKGIEPLILSLDRMGHYGAIYLKRVSGRDFGWSKDLWRGWLADLTPEEFRRQRERARLPRDVIHAGADEYFAVMKLLQDGKDFALVADRLAAVAKEFPRSEAAYLARSLVPQLRAMATEKPPADEWGRLLFRVRDVRTRQSSREQGCYVLGKWNQIEGAPNAALELVARGADAIPHLLRLLEDDRPTRTVTWGGGVIQHRDIAMQCLGALIERPLFPEFSRGSYLSDATRTRRNEIIEVMRRWDREGRKGDEASRLWLKVDLMGLYPALGALHELATKHGRKDDVLKKLHAWYAARHWVYRPHYAELMAVLGDDSKVAAIVTLYSEKEYRDRHVARPDDSAASTNARAAADRLAAGKPRPRRGQQWRDTGHGRR